jgi:DNA (cytosine-5)-methyltransferase 1
MVPSADLNNRRLKVISMRFVDLFCGIGGFHAALHNLGHECVFATDIDSHAASVYESNWGRPGGNQVHCDIRDVIDDIPEMDIICAGFPCQPFSKSGSQQGFQDQTRGTLFHDICTLAEKHKPSVIFLENVPHLVKHDSGNTMKVIESRITELGYKYWWKIISPHDYGTCQIRKRVYIVCIREDLTGSIDFSFPTGKKTKLDIRTILDEKVDSKYNLTKDELYWMNMWEDFLKNVNVDSKLPGHPIWADCFQGTETLPDELHQYNKEQLLEIWKEWQNYGWVKPISNGMSKDELIKAIGLPMWKQSFIRKNRLLYKNNQKFIAEWLVNWKVLDDDEDGCPIIPASRRKYEWQAGPKSRTNWENIFQFRPSGIRVKKGDYFPALVAMAQIPVVGWLKRHITPIECARIQDFDVDGLHGKPFILGDSDQQSYKQLGNAVNVNMIYLIQQSIDKYLNENSIKIGDSETIKNLKSRLSKDDFKSLECAVAELRNDKDKKGLKEWLMQIFIGLSVSIINHIVNSIIPLPKLTNFH